MGKPWEPRKLSQIVSFLDNQRIPISESERTKGEYPYYGATGIIDYINDYLFDDELILLSEDGANLLDRTYPICYLVKGKIWVNNHAHVLKPSSEVNLSFLKDSLERLDYSTFNTGMAMPKLNRKACENIPLLIPSKEEQEKIGTFFDHLDRFITLHEQRLDLLKEQKKGLLQKMFPREGSNVPELRFPEFTDSWEQRKLSEGMTEYTDRIFIEDNKKYKQVMVKNTGKICLRGEQCGRFIGRKRQAAVNLIDHPNTLIFTRQTIEQGGIGFAPQEVDKAIVTENMPTIDVNPNIFNPNYITTLNKTMLWYTNIITPNIEGGTAQVAIHEDKLLNSSILFPSIEEQRMIGLFFHNLDNLITLHQRKLELLKEQKKGLLQKMFPKEGEDAPELRFPEFR